MHSKASRFIGWRTNRIPSYSKMVRTLLAALTGLIGTAEAALFTTDTTIGAGDTSYDSQGIIVSNCTLTINGAHAFASLLLTSNAVVTHASAPAGETNNRLLLTITGNVTIPAGCRVSASGRGYTSAAGPGAGDTRGDGGSGGGHGGQGGASSSGAGSGGIYGLITKPTDFGSGGGNGYGGRGGYGGGVISLDVGETLQVDGTIAADGGAFIYAGSVNYAGGGSGGSVWIKAKKFAGSGVVAADGGAGTTYGGGGGGGRIAMYLASDIFAGTITASGASGSQRAGAGTIFRQISGSVHGQARIDNAGHAGGVTVLSTNYWSAGEVFDLLCTGAAGVRLDDAATVANLRINGGAVLSHAPQQPTFDLTVLGDAVLETNGQINVTGLGYITATGPGAGGTRGDGGSGGSHGGQGGSSASGAVGGGAYDLITAPTQFGSGGGNGYGGQGGSGGGAVRLRVGGTLLVDGAVAADGGAFIHAGSSSYAGGGAGGSLWITAGSLAGIGTVTAKGGAGTGYGGGGGGGRIAMYLDQDVYVGTLTAVGGAGTQRGGAGTILSRKRNAEESQVKIDNGGHTGGFTVLAKQQWSAGDAIALLCTGGSVVQVDNPSALASLRVKAGAVLSHAAQQNTFSLTVLGNAIIETNAQINVVGLGYPSRNGPGAGWPAYNGNGGGGGHGGLGGGAQVYGGAQGGGAVYGSPTQPTDFGSGGANSRAGAGGGAIRLSVDGTLQLDGAIVADGSGAADTHDGGGSGGSILVQVGAMSGQGTISANGGPSGNTGPGGGGGGGRVAIYPLDVSNFDTNHIRASGGSGAEWGRNGTVLLSPSPQVPVLVIQPSNQVALADVTFTAMAVGNPPLHYQWFHGATPLPGGTDTSLLVPFAGITMAQAGGYFAVVTNLYGAVTSQVGQLTIPADLAVSSVFTPSNSIAGAPVNVFWTLTNLGPGEVTGFWQAQVALAKTAAGQDQLVLGTFLITNSIAPGSSLLLTNTVIIPIGIIGQRWLVLAADADNELTEVNEANNTRVASAPITFPSPDLVVSQVSSVGAAHFGEAIDVLWAVTNVGTASATAKWSDRLYLSTVSNSLSGAIPLATMSAGFTPLEPGRGYTATQKVTLPFTAHSVAGSHFIVAVADYSDAQPEGTETNNLRSLAITLALPPLPDLAVENLTTPKWVDVNQTFHLMWTVTNGGVATAAQPWSESIFFSNATSGAQSLMLLEFTNTLTPGAFIVRTQSVVLPITGPAGDLQFFVAVDSRAEIVESLEENNLAAATNTTRVPLVLTLQIPAAEIAEATANPILRCVVARNGDQSQPLDITLTNSDNTEVSIPTSVTIPAGQPSVNFNLQVLPDGVVDGPQTVTLGAAAAGYPSASSQLTVRDADYPHLAVTFQTNYVVEGSSIAAVVSRDLLTTNALSITLRSSQASQFEVPASIVIPAGAPAGIFTATALDDSFVESVTTYTVTATTAGFRSAEASVEVVDDDLPPVTLNIDRTGVSERAGPQAAMGTVTRSLPSTRALIIELNTSDPTAALVPMTVTIPANEFSASFNVAAVDDILMDGSQTTLIGGYVLASQSSTRVAAIKPVPLIVTDDDGPALQLTVSPKLLPEGVLLAATGTVFRNTPATNELIVTLTSGDLTELSPPDPVTIPIGKLSVTFPIGTVNDGTNDGNQNVVLLASATGYASATELVAVSDANLPDLHIPNITTPALADTEASINLNYRVANQGFSAARSNFTTRIFLSSDPMPGNDTLVGQYLFAGTLPVGQHFEQTLSTRLPQAAGNYWVIVETDTGGVIDEALENNNLAISRAPISASAAYSAWVRSSLPSALMGTSVPLSGRATNSLGVGVPFKLVNIHLLVRGTERIISALTDASGNFSATFQPLPGEAGNYQIFATHPGVATAAAQDSFSLMGMHPEGTTVNISVIEGSSTSGAVSIQNLSQLPLTALAAIVSDVPTGLEVSVQLASNTVPGDASINLTYTFSAATATGSGVVPVRLTCAEGAAAAIDFIIAVKALRPSLAAMPTELTAGMARGRQALVEFVLQNLGGLTSEHITVSLPPTPWLQIAVTNPLPALEPGSSNRITLLLTPAVDLPLGPYTGTLMVSCAGASLNIPFNFQCLSEAKGDLVVEAVDEFTYYAEGAPKLTNALVVVRDAVSHLIVTNGLTDARGVFGAANLMEGYYDLEVSASKHNTFTATRLLVAGQTNHVLSFLPRQTVQYLWRVEPAEVEDRTRITVETLFETSVPAPVVTLEPALIDLSEITGDVAQVDLKISNHGLIAANNFQLFFPTHANWEFTPLIRDVGTLAPLSSITIPLTLRRLSTGASGPQKNSASTDCNTAASGCYEYVCGVRIPKCLTLALFNAARNCPKPATPNLPQVFDPPGRPDPSGGSAGQNDAWLDPFRYNPPHIVVTSPSCQECLAKMAKAILDCVVSFAPGGDAAKCTYALATTISPPSAAGGASMLITCLKAVVGEIPVIGTVADILACIDGVLTACAPEIGGGGGGGGPDPKPIGYLAGPLSGLSGAPTKNDLSPGVLASRLPAELGLRYPLLRTLAQRGDRLAAQVNLYRVILGDDDWFDRGRGTNFLTWLIAFNDRALTNSAAGVRISVGERSELLALTFPEGLGATNILKFLDRWNRTIDYQEAGILNLADVPEGQSTDFIPQNAFASVLKDVREAEDANRAEGFTDPVQAVDAAFTEVRSLFLSGGSGDGVCAQVRLQLDQEAVISRDAFKATLEVVNNSDLQIRQVSVNIQLVNNVGQNANNVFGIQSPTLVNLTDINGAGTIEPNTTGRATWVFVPSADAAPSVPTDYYVSGTLSYVQDGLPVTVPLTAVAITVHPNPRLYVNYFHQRDVFSDDPFTDQVEPSIPFSLAVMVENRGQGAAKNMRITSAQPKIVENEKGLLVDFQIIATEVAGQNLVPSLTASFGEIRPGQIGVGRWLLTSSIQGLFEEYKATFEHLDDLGNKKLSLIEEVNIHELNHLVWAGGAFEDGKPDFLVNGVADARDLPDTLYFSDGRTNSVNVVESATMDGPPSAQHLVVQLTAPMRPGWTYLRVPDPGGAQFVLERVVRANDGVEIQLNANVWTTDRTFIGLGRRPIYENLLHLLDYSSTGVYTLHYRVQAAPDTIPPISTVVALPAHSPTLFQVQWSGSDDRSEIAGYDVYASENNGAFLPWLQRTKLTTATFQGTLGAQYTFYCIATDASGNREPAPARPQAITSVTLTNHAPVILAPGDQVIDENTEFVLLTAVMDPDSTDRLTFTLLTGPPGLTLNSMTGELRWFIGEGNGPSTNLITWSVRDNGIPQTTATNSFLLVVREVNMAPRITPLAAGSVLEGRWLRLTNTATDSDLPAQVLTWSLGAGAPAGATIDPGSGLFQWRPSETQGGISNSIAVIVRDNGPGQLSATQTVQVAVIDVLADFTLSLGSTNLPMGDSGSVPIRLSTGAPLTNISFTLTVSETRLTNLMLQPLAAGLASATLQRTDSNTFRISFETASGATLQGILELARLNFETVPSAHSAVADLGIEETRAWSSGGIEYHRGNRVGGRIFIIGAEPILDQARRSAQTLSLVLYGRVGHSYQIQGTTNLGSGSWISFNPVTLKGTCDVIADLPASSPGGFYRALEISDGPSLQAYYEDGQLIINWRLTNNDFTLEQSPVLGAGAIWSAVPDVTIETNRGQAQVTLPAEGTPKFYRLRRRD